MTALRAMRALFDEVDVEAWLREAGLTEQERDTIRVRLVETADNG